MTEEKQIQENKKNFQKSKDGNSLGFSASQLNSAEKEKLVETPKENIDDKKEVLENKEKKENKSVKKKEKIIAKEEAVVNGRNLHTSTLESTYICKFIKFKKIENAIKDLEEVLIKRKAVPMKREIPHRRGKGISSGRYPKNAAEIFIKLLKSLQANANANGIDNPVIVEAVANIGERPYGRFGRIRRKRTHISIKCRELAKIKKVGK